MKRAIVLILLALVATSSLQADVEIETYGVLTLDTVPPHTLAINTFNDQVLIYDAAAGKVLGTLSTGIGVNALEVDRSKGVIYAAETYLSRHTRGTRTDVITTYDIRTLSAINEIEIPPKHASGSPMRHYSGLLTDGTTELMLVVNITPAVSVSVIDLTAGEFLREINTAGCGLIYPLDGLKFLQLCGDGTAQLIGLNPDGSENARIRSDSFFELTEDPLMEKGVRTPSGWVFNTFKGQVFRISASATKVSAQKLFNIAAPEAAGEWRIGGMQPLAYHQSANLLLALVHAGGDDTHKDPGTHIWYYDLATGQQVHELTLDKMVSSIQVSQDNAALIYAGSYITDTLDIYDLKTGTLRHTLSSLPTPNILQNL
ncbi:MAG: amine dehydrogenase large subunit [Gammaproteobacteria bacterium]